MELSGKVALITGGTRMGSAVAQVLSNRGCTIILTWRSSKAAADQTVGELRQQGGNAFAFRCDLSKESSIQQLMKSIQRQVGRLDVLVNLASIYEHSSVIQKDFSKSWDAHLAVNARSAYILSANAAPLMQRSGGGRMVHISDWTSASGRPRYKDYSSYYVSKAAVKAVVETLALELAPSILVNAIAPGPMLPPKGLTAKEDAAVRRATPLGRWGGAGEIAKAALFLIETDFVTGETIRVDGGRHLN